jgi:GLPGLI family protein
MNQIIFIITISTIFSQSLLSQQRFISHGKIEYERKTNQHAFANESNFWDNMAKENSSKFVTYYYDLVFNEHTSLFKQGRDPDVKQFKMWGVFDSENIILTKLDSNKSLTQRDVYGEVFLINDALRKIDWKITTEMRPIAGFDCRKAVGRIMDSIVVIAFYTDEITAAGGPESFAGLPGMILGLAIPRLNTTWYATKLQLTDVTDKDLVAPKKGKPISNTEYRTTINRILKRWEDSGGRREWQFLL